MTRRCSRFAILFVVSLGLPWVSSCSDDQPTAPTAVAAPDPVQPQDHAADDQPPPPPDLLAALWQRVDSGTWTIEQGLVATLQALAENRDLNSVYDGRNAVNDGLGLTGLLATARRYEKHGDDPSTRETIAALLKRIIPDRKTLDVLSAPEPEKHTRLRWLDGLALIPEAHAAMSALCEAAVNNAFPATVTAIAEPCFYRREYRLRGRDGRRYTHRVYYPARWLDEDDTRLEFVDRVQSTITDIVARYTDMGGRMRALQVVFTEAMLGRKTMAFTDGGGFFDAEWSEDGLYCDINVLERSYSRSLPEFKQILAHEMAHCYQLWNYPRQMQGPPAALRWDEVKSWWSEGTAEYLSNLVYPETNFEWRKSGLLDRHSGHTPVHRQSYSNFAFFQHLGNQIGENSVLDLIASMPVSGTYRQQARALAGFGNMQELLQLFGQQYLDRKLTDSSGEVIPFNPDRGRVYEIGPGEIMVSAPPLVLKRVRLKFPGDTTATIRLHETGAAGINRIRAFEPAAAWRQFLESMGNSLSFCGDATERDFQWLLTSADGGDRNYEVGVTVQPQDHLDASSGLRDSDIRRYRGLFQAAKVMREGLSGAAAGFLAPHIESAMPDGESAESLKTTPEYCAIQCLPDCLCAHPELHHSMRAITPLQCTRIGFEKPDQCREAAVRAQTTTVAEVWCGRICSEQCASP